MRARDPTNMQHVADGTAGKQLSLLANNCAGYGSGGLRKALDHQSEDQRTGL